MKRLIYCGVAAFLCLAAGSCAVASTPAPTSTEKAWYEVQLGTESVRVESETIRHLAKKAELKLVDRNGDVQMAVQGAGIAYFLASDGTKYFEGDSVPIGCKLTPVYSEHTVVLPNYWENGYSFIGWLDETDSPIVYLPGNDFVFDKSITLKPLLHGNIYTVQADDETLSVVFGEIPSKIRVPEDNLALISESSYQTINSFNGYWYRDKQYFNSAGLPTTKWDIPNNVVLEARWDKIDKLPTATKTGYHFLGWSKSGTKYDIGSVPQNGNLYAVFEPNEYYLNVKGKKVSVKFNQYLESIETTEKFGYDFAGYFVNDGQKEVCVYDGKGVCVTPWKWACNKEAFARWSKKTISGTRGTTINVGKCTELSFGNAIDSMSVSNSNADIQVKGTSLIVKGVRYGTTQCIVNVCGNNVLINVSVMKEPSKVTLNFKKKSLQVGKTIILNPKTDAGSYSPTFTYKISNKRVVKISGNYLYAAKKGKAVITVTASNGKKCKAKVVVKG